MFVVKIPPRKPRTFRNFSHCYLYNSVLPIMELLLAYSYPKMTSEDIDRLSVRPDEPQGGEEVHWAENVPELIGPDGGSDREN